MLRIKELAKQKGYTMQELADKIGVVRDTLTRQANGNPTISTLQKIAEALEVNVTDLFTDGDERTPNVIKCPHCDKDIILSVEKK